MSGPDSFAAGDLVSIVVPVFNRAHLVARSIASLCHQSYRNIEIIIVDDASSDDLDSALAALDDPRIRLVRRARNGGVAAARNDGMAAAQGAVIAFFDSDDICVFNRIERQAAVLADAPETVIGVYSSRLFHAELDEADYAAMRSYVRPWPQERPLSGDLFRATLRNNMINFPSLMVRRAALERAGPCDPLLRNNVDWDHMLRLTREGTFAFIPDPLLITPNPLAPEKAAARLSKTVRFHTASFVRITGKLRRAGHAGPELAGHYCTAANYLMRTHRSRFARRFLRAALRLKPISSRPWRLYLLSHTPRLFNRLRLWRERRRGLHRIH